MRPQGNSQSSLGHGVISLERLYAFAEKHEANEDAIRLEKTALGREYSALCGEVTRHIQDAQGFYLWGVFDSRRYWHSIYLGKAGFGSTKSLKKRICEELKDERAFLWRAFYREGRLLQIRDRIHPHGKYSWHRAMKKRGSTHVLWVSAPSFSSRSIEPIEADLIEALNPRANIRRPTPPHNVQREASKIFEKFRSLIHVSRSSKRILTRLQEKELIETSGRPMA
jgi:hypothetical protein